jgi:hypothetical protein
MYPTKSRIAKVLTDAGYQVREQPHGSEECRITTIISKREYLVDNGSLNPLGDIAGHAGIACALSEQFAVAADCYRVVVRKKKVPDGVPSAV